MYLRPVGIHNAVVLKRDTCNGECKSDLFCAPRDIKVLHSHRRELSWNSDTMQNVPNMRRQDIERGSEVWVSAQLVRFTY